MDDTYLHVYPGCLGGQAEKSKRVTLALQQGDVLFFRGDLAHAGAKYCKENIRPHCYARVRGVSQKKNATEAVIFKTFRCSKYMAGAYSLKKLAAHKRECAVDNACKCPYCPESYDKPNSLTKHITRKHRSVHKGRSRCQASKRCEEANEDSEKDVDMASEEEDEGSEINEDEESEDDMSEEDEASENSEENDSGDSEDDEVSEESEESEEGEESESDAEDYDSCNA
ncbi:hypothetical protein PF003_g37567 [Phytophthora fragariae]|uniref:C2H2-type domain-containing protein n=1 Tax=Phytophthora fragariae TaxID=53985 RepID=A0A6A3DFY4_9STRA|nr:hypothetical protein PF003_g37567 [Phytophthora fragariae]KAE8917408.1 hypothetical protein PF009_g32270 [Phytophthora fragariae]